MSLVDRFVPQFPESEVHGALARYPTTGQLYRACERVRDAGYTRWDAHTPFPVHGLEKAMGLAPSKLPFIVLATGLGGAGLGFLLQTWVHSAAYPLIISGKPLFAWPSFVPVTFELGVLGAALGAVLGMLVLNRLPMFYHPLFRSRLFERVTDDGLFICIEAADPKFDAEETVALLRAAGAEEVELVPGNSAADAPGVEGGAP